MILSPCSMLWTSLTADLPLFVSLGLLASDSSYLEQCLFQNGTLYLSATLKHFVLQSAFLYFLLHLFPLLSTKTGCPVLSFSRYLTQSWQDLCFFAGILKRAFVTEHTSVHTSITLCPNSTQNRASRSRNSAFAQLKRTFIFHSEKNIMIFVGNG